MVGEPLKSEDWWVGVRTSFQVQMEAIGGCKQKSDLFLFCKLALAAVRRVDLRGQEGKEGAW